jgi:hypothetical protein
MKINQAYTNGDYFAELFERPEAERGKYPNHPFLVVFQKRQKSKMNPVKTCQRFLYQDYNRAVSAMQEWVDGWVARDAQRKAEQAERRKTVDASEFYKVGDIVANSWGYEQTNVEFYRVVEVLPKSIRVAELMQKVTEKNFMAGETVPAEDLRPNGTEYLLRVKSEGRLSNPKSYYYFRKSDGRPEYVSWYA